jgi:hypothetical protein
VPKLLNLQKERRIVVRECVLTNNEKSHLNSAAFALYTLQPQLCTLVKIDQNQGLPFIRNGHLRSTKCIGSARSENLIKIKIMTQNDYSVNPIKVSSLAKSYLSDDEKKFMAWNS